MTLNLNKKEIQASLYEMMLEIISIFEKADISYFISFGTLLGAVRHGGFIPWDDDVDIQIHKFDIPKAKKILKEQLSFRYKVLEQKDDYMNWEVSLRVRDSTTILPDLPQNGIANGLFIDIIEFESITVLNRLNYTLLRYLKNKYIQKPKAGNNSHALLKSSFFRISYALAKVFFNLFELLPLPKKYVLSDKWFGGMFKKEDVFPTTFVKFEDKEVLAPQNYVKILTSMYGDYSQIPAEEEQSKHFIHCYKLN